MQAQLLQSFEESGVYNTVTIGDFDMISNNYITGVSGWRISPNGDAEFQNVTVRGDFISNATGTSSFICTLESGIILGNSRYGSFSISPNFPTVQNSLDVNWGDTNFASLVITSGTSPNPYVATKLNLYDTRYGAIGLGGAYLSFGAPITDVNLYRWYSDTEGTPSLTGILATDSYFLVRNIKNYSDNASALAGGLRSGVLYRNGDVLQIVH